MIDRNSAKVSLSIEISDPLYSWNHPSTEVNP